MNHSRPRMAFALAVVLALGAAACGSSSSEKSTTAATTNPADANAATTQDPAKLTTVKIMVGGLNKVIYLPAKLTEQLGYFKEQGLNVQLTDEPSGVDAETAMLAGEVDGVVGFYDHTVDLQGKGKGAESVVQFAQAPGEVVMVANKNANTIKSPKDFAGKKMGVTGLGSSTNFLTKYLGTTAGVTENQFTSVAVGAGDTFIAAIKNGGIDAGMTTDPTVARLLKSGDASVLIDMRTVDGSKAALGGLYPSSSLYMTTDYVNRHPDTVQKLANAFVKTLKYMKTHSPQELADKMPADYYGNDKDLYIKAMADTLPMFTADGVMPDSGPETVLKCLSAFDDAVKGKNIDLSKTFTRDFVKKAAA